MAEERISGLEYGQPPISMGSVSIDIANYGLKLLEKIASVLKFGDLFSGHYSLNNVTHNYLHCFYTIVGTTQRGFKVHI